MRLIQPPGYIGAQFTVGCWRGPSMQTAVCINCADYTHVVIRDSPLLHGLIILL